MKIIYPKMLYFTVYQILMNSGKYVFTQIMGLVSSTSFQTIVKRHFGDYKIKEFSCWKQFLCMAFGQLTHRESLSDSLMSMKANAGKLYHLGSVIWFHLVLLQGQMKIVHSEYMKNFLCY